MQNNQKQSFSIKNLSTGPKINQSINYNIRNSDGSKKSSLLHQNPHQFYQNNQYQYKSREAQIQQKLQPHNKVSIKGLFTFYREQQQNQQNSQPHPQKPKPDKNRDKSRERKKQKQKQIEQKIYQKIEQEINEIGQQLQIKKQVRKNTRSKSRSKSKNQRLEKKLRTGKNLSVLQEHKNKKKKKGKKSTRQSTERMQEKQNDSQKQSQIKQQLPQQKQEEEQPAQKFLRNIKQNKLMKNRNHLNQSQLQNKKTLINNLPISAYASPTSANNQQHQKQEERQKFNKLFYPKQSSASQLIVDDINADLQKLESQNKFMQLKGNNKNTGRDKDENKVKDPDHSTGKYKQYKYKYEQSNQNTYKFKESNKDAENLQRNKSGKKKIVIDEIFLKRSSSEIQKSLSYRKRLYTEQDPKTETQKSDKKLQKKHSRLYTYGRDNIYSQMKLKQIIELAHRISLNREQAQPISPPTIKSQTNNARIQQISSMFENHPLKLPVIRNVRLSRQLRKIQQLKTQQQNRYNSIKSKNSSNTNTNKNTSKMLDKKTKQKMMQKLNKSKSTDHHNHNVHKIVDSTVQNTQKQIEKQKQKQMQKGRLLIKKKLQTEPQVYCVALIDLSKSVNSGVEERNKKNGKKGEVDASWNLKKKILFKKLGLSP